MISQHQVMRGDARRMTDIPDASVQLVVTSPPYPMIQMWDESFANQSLAIKSALDANKGNLAYELMHQELDKVWGEVGRVLCDGSFVCINIGDATRTIGERFALYSSHSRIVQAFVQMGFDVLPPVIWKKATNAPNKFMGSGMLPAGAYVTLEHEYILIFRKGGKRQFKSEEDKALRNSCAFFWEERNQWFSDIWELKGVRQKLTSDDVRERSAAYPFELPYRLINMYSAYGDTVLDPFVGTGTTIVAAMATGRNSIGVEIEAAFMPVVDATVQQVVRVANERLATRVADHLSFVTNREITHGECKHKNVPHGFPVMTRQEAGLALYSLDKIEPMLHKLGFEACYSLWDAEKSAVVPSVPVKKRVVKSDKSTVSLFAGD